MNPFIVVAYYTLDTIYEEKVQVLIDSLEKFKIPYYIKPIKNLGSWYKNTGYKPTFLKEMLKKFPDDNIVYIDADAEFFAYPNLFETLDCNVGVHHFDLSLHGNRTLIGFDVLSGTIFLKNNEEVYNIVTNWENECKKKPHVWDQRHLEKVLGGNFYNLPYEYCAIFNLMSHIKNPIIVHYQCSREIRKKKCKLKMR